LRAALHRWFGANRRELPWRRHRTAYRVWIAEVMLQQTQVATVVPYYRRFLDRFPSLQSLSRARLPQVLALWKGLGYYSRARNLHRAARQMARSGFPRTAQLLRELPGFGPYTSAAVASLAFGEPVPVVDGNVSRVLCRLRAIRDPPGRPGREQRLWAIAASLLDRQRPGAFNEALMELGALVCTPADPLCECCPLSTLCEARRRGLTDSIPPPRVRPVRTRLDLACAVVIKEGALLLARRPEQGLFGGLWELPSVVVGPGSAPRALQALGMKPVDRRAFAIVRRTLTHRELTLRLFRCGAPGGALAGYLEQRYVRRERIAGLAISSAMAAAIQRSRHRGDGAIVPSSPSSRPGSQQASRPSCARILRAAGPRRNPRRRRRRGLSRRHRAAL
jgi:A/G-specific adenine glycosylase